jgi:hypothetical protein
VPFYCENALWLQSPTVVKFKIVFVDMDSVGHGFTAFLGAKIQTPEQMFQVPPTYQEAIHLTVCRHPYRWIE